MKRIYPKISDHKASCRERAMKVGRVLRDHGLFSYKDPRVSHIRFAVPYFDVDPVRALLIDKGINMTGITVERIQASHYGIKYPDLWRTVIRVDARVSH